MSHNDPLSVIESLAQSNDWPFERPAQDEISMVVAGRWAEYQITFAWMSDTEVLHLACGFPLKVVPHRLNEIKELVSRINQELWVGHFDYFAQEDMILFRHGSVFAEEVRPTPVQCAALFNTALEACEDHYPAFNFVLWSGKSAKESLEAVHALSTVEGEA